MRTRATAARACRSASRSLTVSESLSLSGIVAFLAISDWKNGYDFLLPGSGQCGKRLKYAFGSAIHEQVGKPVGVVAGVVGQDVGRLRVFGSRSDACPGRSRRAGPSACHGRDAGLRAKVPRIDGIDRYQVPEPPCRPLPPTWRHPGRSSPGRWRLEANWHRLALLTPARSRAAESGVEWWIFRASRRTGNSSAVAFEKATEEVIDLSVIDRQQGEAGVEVFPVIDFSDSPERRTSRGLAHRR